MNEPKPEIQVGDLFTYFGKVFVALSVVKLNPFQRNVQHWRVYVLDDVPNHDNWDGFYEPSCVLLREHRG